MERKIAQHSSSLWEILQKLFPDCSKRALRTWVDSGRIHVNRKVIKDKEFFVEKGQEVALCPRKKILEGDVELLYEDRDILVVDKPEGLLSVDADFDQGNSLFSLLKKRERGGRVFVVHRLDQGTSGVMLFARNPQALRHLKEQFKEHSLKREYMGLVDGHLEKKKGEWRSYLYEDPRYKVHETTKASRGSLAITHYSVLKEKKNTSLVRFRLHTGKKNQIRVHCASAGTPILGDEKYGSTKDPFSRLCLHAVLLEIEHPSTGKRMRFSSPWPSLFGEEKDA